MKLYIEIKLDISELSKQSCLHSINNFLQGVSSVPWCYQIIELNRSQLKYGQNLCKLAKAGPQRTQAQWNQQWKGPETSEMMASNLLLALTSIPKLGT